MLKWKRKKIVDMYMTTYRSQESGLQFQINNWGRIGAELIVWVETGVQQKNGEWTTFWDKKLDINCNNVREAKEKAEAILASKRAMIGGAA